MAEISQADRARITQEVLDKALGKLEAKMRRGRAITADELKQVRDKLRKEAGKQES